MTLRPRSARFHSSVTRLGVDEGNHAEMPALMAGAVRPGQLTRVFEKEILRKGEVIKQVWKVMGTAEYGLPTNTDADVYYALMEMSDEQRWPRRLSFSLYELIERMGWNHSGASYRNARESLKRWATVRIEATNSFYVLRDREYRGTLVWGFIDEALVPPRHEVADRSSPMNHIVWNEHFLQSIKDGYLFAIDLDLFRRLRHRPLARRLYTFLNKKFGKKDLFAIELKKLAHQHLGIAESRSSPAQIRAILDPAADLLKENGYLNSWSYRRNLRRDTRVHFRREQGRGIQRADPAESQPSPQPIHELHRRIFGGDPRSVRPQDEEAAASFFREHGEAAWHDFIAFVEAWRREQWPNLATVAGALSLLPRFVADALPSAEEDRRAELRESTKETWRQQADQEIERLRGDDPARHARLENELLTNRDYLFWLGAADGRNVMASNAHTRRLNRQCADDLRRNHFAKALEMPHLPTLEQLLPSPEDEAQQRLPL